MIFLSFRKESLREDLAIKPYAWMSKVDIHKYLRHLLHNHKICSRLHAKKFKGVHIFQLGSIKVLISKSTPIYVLSLSILE
jgi:hypothetical protein